MEVYIFLRSHLDKSKPQNSPIKIDASCDKEASKKAKELGSGELFKKIFMEMIPEEKKKNGFMKG